MVLLALFEFHLQSTAINCNNLFYTQKAGIFIGSYATPILSDMFLSCIDKGLRRPLLHLNIFRYVDDYLVIMDKLQALSIEEAVADIYTYNIQKCCKTLNVYI